ncbi:hypothetical protein GALMADRAFT_139584 [Galerina marginata CBS 339.88]|uniref:F-box domain-containing protein n=1 Tax=Galerina marginata (strain CBS 339.88) TaxID=685588 RepID=A0A067T0L2_GALM3|nr:hypothetical protein GALMADRAFT_139584 [Galerina marginata CBS 339.88]
MQPQTTLPFDILAYTIDILAAEDEGDEDIKSLQMLSGTCKLMVPLCRRHLFSSLNLLTKSQSERFGAVLFRNPNIARYVRSLKYDIYDPINDHEPKILDLLKERSSSLQSIALSSHQGFDWNELPLSIQSSLVFLIQLRSVTHLQIQCFRNFPSTALALCHNLIFLGIAELEVAPPAIGQVISRSNIPAPVTIFARTNAYDGLAVLMTSPSAQAGPLVDFSRLQQMSFHVDSSGDIGHIGQLLKATTQLQSLNITSYLPLDLAGLGTSLMVNAYRTLRSVALGIVVRGNDSERLCGLSGELRSLSGNNILQEFELNVVIAPGRTETEEWAAIDWLLTESGAFPMLHRVSIEIRWSSDGREVPAIDDILGSLTKERFPRLVESTVVEFNFYP